MKNKISDTAGSAFTLGQPDARSFLAAIVESSQDSIVTIDMQRSITTWNRAAEHLYGYKAEEVLGRSLEMVLLPEDVTDLINKVARIAHSLEVPIYETVRIHKTGRSVDLQIALSPVRNQAGQIIGISTIARDITEAKLQEQLKDEFIAVASHELKTPVTSIRIYSELLLERMHRTGDKENVVLMEKLDLQIDRLMKLISSLLDTNRITAGEVLLNLESFDLSSLVAEQIGPLRDMSPRDRIDFSESNRYMVTADRQLIGEVITNLVSNAVKYSPEDSRVLIRIRESDAAIKLSVQDFGIGIPEGLSSRIFERYFRVNHPQRSKIQGIGLGLYIAASIIHQHDGKISVDSREGVGSVFTFELPVKRAENTATDGSR